MKLSHAIRQYVAMKQVMGNSFSQGTKVLQAFPPTYLAKRVTHHLLHCDVLSNRVGKLHRVPVRSRSETLPKDRKSNFA